MSGVTDLDSYLASFDGEPGYLDWAAFGPLSPAVRNEVQGDTELLGSGRDHGCELTYRVQDEAGGIAQALGLAEHFCANARCAVVLGDNIFADGLGAVLGPANSFPNNAWVALKEVSDPERYGVAELVSGRIRYEDAGPGLLVCVELPAADA